MPLIFLVFLFNGVFAQGLGPATEARLQAAIEKIQNESPRPFIGGMSVVVRVEGFVPWLGASGFAARNIDQQNNLEPGGSPFATSTLSQIYSVTKTFTAALVLELAQEGVFALGDSISKYLPFHQINPRLDKGVTIRQLLAHESGYSDYAIEPQLQIRVAAQPGRAWTPYEAISFTNQIFPAGAERRYSNTNYIILGALVEALTSKPIEQHFRERFFGPLGLASMYLGVREPIGNRGVLAAPHDNISPFNPIFAQTGQPLFPNAYTNITRFPMTAVVSLAFTGGGIVSNAADLAAWGSALYTGRATSQAVLDSMVNSIAPTPDGNGNRLGYGIKSIPHISDTEAFLGHNGDAAGYRSVLVHHPERKVTLAVLSNFAGADPYAIAKALYLALAPQLISFSPRQGLPGRTVILHGEGLATTTAVRFNGIEAPFEVISESKVKVVVPPLATNGRISIVTAGGVVESSQSFAVLEPRISVFYPEAGKVGSSVILLGAHLGKTREVYFNGQKAQNFRTYLEFLVVAQVPPGATSGKISLILNGGGKAYSSSDFIVGPAPSILAVNQEPGKLTRQIPEAPVETVVQEPGVLLYPNPVRDKLTFSFVLPQALPVRVEVFDSQGREQGLLYQGEAQANKRYQVEWQPGLHLSPGLYIIRLQTPKHLSRYKIILSR